MTEKNEPWADHLGSNPDELERPLTSAADVESAGRSCIVIVAMTIVILVLLGIWVLYTTS